MPRQHIFTVHTIYRIRLYIPSNIHFISGNIIFGIIPATVLSRRLISRSTETKSALSDAIVAHIETKLLTAGGLIVLLLNGFVTGFVSVGQLFLVVSPSAHSSTVGRAVVGLPGVGLF